MDYAKHLIERITAAPKNERVAVLSNELLREFHRGYPLDDLRLLLKSADESLLAISAWIASELGEKSRPLLGEIVHLLNHPYKNVRFWAIDCMVWTLPHNGCDLAEACKLLDDPEPGIRWKTLDILSRLSPAQIAAAHECLERTGQDSSHLSGLKILSAGALDLASIFSSLRSQDSIVRKYALVAAVRQQKQHPELLDYASTVDDDDIKNFLTDL